MGKVIFRLPSKGTQSGYAEYSFEHEADGGDEAGYALGVQYKHFVDNFQRGEAASQADTRLAYAIKATVEDSERIKAAIKADARKEVLGEQFGSNFREPTEEEAKALIVERLGASVYDEEVEEQAAPWEDPPAAPADDDWDF